MGQLQQRVRRIDTKGAVIDDRAVVVEDVPDAIVVAPQVDDRIGQLRDKALAILNDPAGAPDWTAGERKVILALFLLRASR